MNDLSKSIAAAGLAIFACCILSSNVQAGKNGGHGPAPFSEFDMDGNGTISESEFYSVRQQRMAARASEGKKMRCAKYAPSFEDLDTDRSGNLNQEELSAGQKTHRSKCKEMGQGAGDGHGKKRNMPGFTDFDLDGDGMIVESEFNEVHASKMAEMSAAGRQMKHAGESPSFSGIDTDGDGSISEQEFSDHQAAHHHNNKAQPPRED